MAVTAANPADSGLDEPAAHRHPGLIRVVAGKGRRSRVPRPVRRLTGPLLLLALWQLGSTTGIIPADVLASPATVLSSFWHLLTDGELVKALVVSLQRVVLGLLIGGTIGISLAVIAGLFRLGEDLVDAPVQMLRTVPFVGLIPLLIIWFGIGETPKIALVCLGVGFPLYLNVYAGIRNVDGTLVEAARTLGLSRLGLIRHVVLPGALPSALVGLRYSLGIAWLALVFAEQINATAGLGYLMNQAREYFLTDVIVVCLVVYAFLGLTADLIVRLLERTLLSWRPAFTGS